MSNTKIGAKRAALTNLAKDPDFYRKIGKKGGQNGHTGGFASMTHEQVIACARKGGRISRRGPAKHY